MAKSILIKEVQSKAQVAAAQKEILRSIGVRGLGSSIFRKDTRVSRYVEPGSTFNCGHSGRAFQNKTTR